MRMLEAGGCPVLKDDVREPDEHNPNGYYELEAVKSGKVELPGGKQAAVKIVSPLLKDVEAGEHWVVFMRRGAGAIEASQQKLAPGKKINWDKHLRQILSKPRFPTLPVWYSRVLENPLMQSHWVAEFLDMDLDESKMAEVVDKGLCHHDVRPVG